MSMPELTIRDVKVRSVVVPMAHPLVTRVITIEQLALLLIDLRTEEGITGRAYLFGFSERGNSYLAPLVRDLAEICHGDKVVPIDLYTKMQKSLTLFGHEGLTLMVLSGIDMACWDALGQAAEVPVASLLGGGTGPIPAYNSNGMGLTDDLGVLADEARRLIAEGDFRAIKVRLGRDTLAEDISAFRAVRGAVGDEILLPVDFNQGLDVAEALKRGHALDEEDVYWIEEPIVYDNLTGCAELAAALNTPIQIGENFWGPKALSAAIEAKALAYAMPDLERIGGITGWLCAAAIANEAAIPLSSHIFPEASVHVMAATPTAHWLEYVDWAAPVLTHPLVARDGHVRVPDRPGLGIDWNEDAVARYQVTL
ncbi:MAG: mandelate racemase [Rhodospirillaceae bacterium]|nr:mandelate racemase [Rhodospirillaceae bacterium]